MKRTRTPDLDSLQLKIHCAALQPALWQEVTDTLADILDAERGVMLEFSADPDDPFSAIVNMDPACLQAYGVEYSRDDVWLQGALATGRTRDGVVNLGEQLVDRRDFLHTRFYNEFLRPYDIDRFLNVVMAGPSGRSPMPSAAMSFFRGAQQDTFSERDVQLLQRLAPHFVVAMRNAVSARRFFDRCKILGHVVDAVNIPMLVVDGAGRLNSANVAGEEFLKQTALFAVKGDYLVAGGRSTDTAALDRLFRCMSSRVGCDEVLSDPVTGARMIVSVSPITPPQADSLPGRVRPVALVWIIPVASQGSAADRFDKVFGLSPSEGRLMREFAATEDLNVAAARLARSVHTVRNQMKSILAKTGKHSQAQLLALYSRLASLRSP